MAVSLQCRRNLISVLYRRHKCNLASFPIEPNIRNLQNRKISSGHRSSRTSKFPFQGCKTSSPSEMADKILTQFTWNACPAEKVSVAGSFSDWRLIPMEKASDGFVVDVSVRRGDHVFKYFVDDRWCYDVRDSTESDEDGNINNVLHDLYWTCRASCCADGSAVEAISRKCAAQCCDIGSFSDGDEAPTFFKWCGNASAVQIIGSFNNWAESVELQKDEATGIFFVHLELKPKFHFYKYIVDGEWRVDDFVETGHDFTGNLNNVLVVEPEEPPAWVNPLAISLLA